MSENRSSAAWAGEDVVNVHKNAVLKNRSFHVVAPFDVSGDQGQAIEQLSRGIEQGDRAQTLKGVTGSGKTFTMAKIIERINRPTLVLSHNKTLAAQLYREFKSFFPDNAVEYFVSTYDYYQPEAYVPGKDLYIEKEADINDEIDRLRLSASFSLMERRDVVVISTVSCIYGLGNPVSIKDMIHSYTVGEIFDHKSELEQLVRMLYERNDMVLSRGTFRVRGDVIEIYPAYLESAVRITLDWDEIVSIDVFDPLTLEKLDKLDSFTLYPAKQFVMPKEALDSAIVRIENELRDQLDYFESQGKLVEKERLKSRVEYDIEMLKEVGYCSGIENYSRPLAGRAPGERPAVLLDYFPDDFIVFIDCLETDYISGFFHDLIAFHTFSATVLGRKFTDGSSLAHSFFRHDQKFCSLNGKLHTDDFVPTGLLDPSIEVRSTEGQMEDLFGEINKTVRKGERVLVTTLTKKMAEDLTNYLSGLGLRVRYLHSEIETIERVEILTDLRKGVFDVLVGINLLREGLDLPEVALVAILDADKIGFLRSATSLIQTIGRAARNADGRVIMYADQMSDAMKEAINETEHRRAVQMAYNEEHGITPTTIRKAVEDILERQMQDAEEIQKDELKIQRAGYNLLSDKDRKKYVRELEKEMRACAERLEFEKAAAIRDEIEAVKSGSYITE